jgi:hypothetical protein
VVEQDEALLALIARALDLHREPDENPRFYGALSADAMTEEDEEDDEAQEEDLEAPVEMWDSKRVAHFLALCCFTPTNTYSAQGHGPEEDFLVHSPFLPCVHLGALSPFSPHLTRWASRRGTGTSNIRRSNWFTCSMTWPTLTRWRGAFP